MWVRDAKASQPVKLISLACLGQKLLQILQAKRCRNRIAGGDFSLEIRVVADEYTKVARISFRVNADKRAVSLCAVQSTAPALDRNQPDRIYPMRKQHEINFFKSFFVREVHFERLSGRLLVKNHPKRY